MCRLLWKAIYICEKVISVDCNGESPNCKLFQMHCHLTKDDDVNPKAGFTYCTHSLFSGTEKKFFYFISDVPHLLKTAQNSLSNSGGGKFF